MKSLTEKIKEELRADVAGGVIPATVLSFAQLHDYVDANTYGLGDCWHPLDGYTWEQHCERLNKAQNEVDAWIKAGGLLCVC